MRKLPLLAASLCAAVLLSACGDQEPQSGSAPNADNGAPLSLLDQELPFLSSMNDEFGDDNEAREAALVAEANRREESIAACMAKQGFEYRPVIAPVAVPRVEDDSQSQLERLEQEGWGYFVTIEQPGGDGDSINQDPNSALLESMSDAERKAWEEALWGKTSEQTEEWSWETNGCDGAAWHEISPDEVENPGSGPWELLEKPEWAELADWIYSKWERIDGSPEMQQVNKDWSQCMADAGHPGYASVGDIYDYLASVDEDLRKDLPPVADTEWANPDFIPPQPDPALMKKAHEEEVELAVADYRCNEKIEYQKRTDEIRISLDNEFYENNKDLVKAFAAAAATESK